MLNSGEPVRTIMVLPGGTRGCASRVDPRAADESRGARKNVHQPQVTGNAPCSATLHEFVSESPDTTKNLSHSQPLYATLAQVLHGVKKPQSYERRRSTTLLANGAASADR